MVVFLANQVCALGLYILLVIGNQKLSLGRENNVRAILENKRNELFPPPIHGMLVVSFVC